MKELEFKPDVKLSRLTTLGIGGKARLMAEPQTPSDIQACIKFAKTQGLRWFVLGNGSDVLFSDEGFDGLVIRTLKLSEFHFEGTNLIALCGAKLPKLVRTTTRLGLSGLENLVGIPGTVGGAVAKNAGAFGREISELINWLEFIDMDGNVIKLERDELRFGYRWSEFPQKGILLRVSLHLVESEPSKSMDLMMQFLKRRRKTQPLGKTAGCVFKNPPNAQPAGYLLDKAGLKGFRVGGAKFSEIHANFVINAGGATAHDVVKLMQIGKNRVFDKFGVNLEPEIVMVGVEL